MKHVLLTNGRNPVKVAPYVGAWVETIGTTATPNYTQVAPYVGAWVETDIDCI